MCIFKNYNILPTLAANNARGLKPVVEILKKAGGWPVLEKNWKKNDWSFINTEILLRPVSDSALIKVALEQYPTDPSKLAIWVSTITTLSTFYFLILQRTETIKIQHI